MKPNHNSDPLDQQIDALFASRPLKPSEDFTARVLAAADADNADTKPHSKHPLSKLIKFALPLAAAITVTVSLLQFESQPGEPSANSVSSLSNNLNSAEAQEIFLLEESLANLATLSTTELGTQNLLSTLDALYLEI
ncbi:hypothetical protein QEH59_09850 [Coraliomargarita sp. SDUM461004]|uniref:Uncharacterized protein n=1 Tax=Thalassobacterium sedimentorum TaxID=3041258 RepID=A0ABU1AIX9_9BACT|nr:hypothetical protein [Coraliomargarita sp. SDUM461004]MDQ8194728.1 hypothetical protein [Coraliomargarita sp. SDUM461004]